MQQRTWDVDPNHGTNVLILTILFITIHVSELSSMACKEEKQIVSGLGILHQPLHGLQDVLPGGCLMCHRPAAGLLGIRQDLQLWSPDFCMLQCNQDVLQGPNRSKENFQAAQHGHAVLAALVCRCYQNSLHHWRIFWHCRRCGDRLLVREGLHALIHPWHGAPVGLFESTTSGNLGLYQGIQFGLRQWPQSWICLQGFAHIEAVVAQDVDHPHGPDLLFEQLFFLSKKFFFGKHLGRWRVRSYAARQHKTGPFLPIAVALYRLRSVHVLRVQKFFCLFRGVPKIAQVAQDDKNFIVRCKIAEPWKDHAFLKKSRLARTPQQSRHTSRQPSHPNTSGDIQTPSNTLKPLYVTSCHLICAELLLAKHTELLHGRLRCGLIGRGCRASQVSCRSPKWPKRFKTWFS